MFCRWMEFGFPYEEPLSVYQYYQSQLSIMTIVETALYREKYIYFGTVHFLWHAPDFLLGVPIPPLALPKTNGKPQDSDTRIPK